MVKNEHSFQLDNYEGPLDLLLDLIKTKKMNISEISLIKVVDQFVNLVESEKELNLTDISEYLILSSELLKIKSKYFLRLENETNFSDLEDDEAKKLIARLIEYQKYKDLSEKIFKLFNNQPQLVKISDDLEEFIIENTTKNYILPSGDPEDIKNALVRIFNTIAERSQVVTNFKIKKISLEDRKKELSEIINEEQEINFQELFIKDKSVYMLAITFLCLLEMSNSGLIEIFQDEKRENQLIIRRV